MDMEKRQVLIYDCTLRDGTQGENISLSVPDKLRIAERLDEFGVHYIEGGWPGSNPKDAEFFDRAARMSWKRSRIAAFGSTRHWKYPVDRDPNLKALLDAETPTVTVVGKSWDFHVREALGIELDENLRLIRESVEYLKSHGKDVVFDAEHFFDGCRANPKYAEQVLTAAAEAGADWLVLCDTNDVVFDVGELHLGFAAGSNGSASTPTMTVSLRWPIRWWRSRPGPAWCRGA